MVQGDQHLGCELLSRDLVSWAPVVPSIKWGKYLPSPSGTQAACSVVWHLNSENALG